MNLLKIYKGKTPSASTEIHGVDADTFTLTTTLDETFDYGMFSVVADNLDLKSRDYITIQEIDTSYTPQRVWHEEIYIVDVVGSAVVKKVGNTELKEYQVSFIEQTAELKNILCPNIETCQPLPPLWTSAPSTSKTELVASGTENARYGFIKCYQLKWTEDENVTIGVTAGQSQEAQIVLPTKLNRRYGTRQLDGSISWQSYSNKYFCSIKDESGTVVAEGWNDDEDFQATTLEVGKYKFVFYYKNDELFLQSSNWRDEGILNYDFEVYKNTDDRNTSIADKYHTKYDVLEKLVYSIKPYKTSSNGQPTNPKYILGEDCEYLKNELCPDLFLTGNDLYTNLLLIGRTINSIPYLTGNTIHFMNLGDKTHIPFTFSQDAFNGKVNVSDYERCGALVSDLSNMIPTNKIGTSTIEDSWRTLETEVGEQFTADNCFYRSDFNMYALKDFKMKFWNGSTYSGEYSLAKYMFESSAYACLDATQTGKTNSKNRALCWSQYANKISGFTVKSSEYTATELLVYTAICNIIHEVSGATINNDLIQNWHKRVMFKAVYVPVVNAKVKQYREDARIFNDNEMIVAQQTNLGSLELTGDSMHNSFIQTGNETYQQNTFVGAYYEIPEINQQFEDSMDYWKVAKVVRSYSINGFDLSILYVKNFNRISANQSLATEKRWADVPMSNAIKRTIALEDYCIVSHGTPTTTTKNWTSLYLTEAGQKTAINSLMQNISGANYNKALSFVFRLKSYDVVYPNSETCNADKLQSADSGWIRLPVVVGAFGNSLFIKAICKDNYSASTCLVNRSVNGTTYKFAIDIPYSDENGEAQLLDFRIVTNETDFTTIDQENAIITSTEPSGSILAKGDDIYLNKGSREQLEFVYQLHFIGGDNTTMIGNAISEFNGLIVDKKILEEKRQFHVYATADVTSRFDSIPEYAIELPFEVVNDELVLRVEDESGISTFYDLFGGDSGMISLILACEYEQDFYDGRLSQSKKEIICAENLDLTSIWNKQVSGYKPFKFTMSADYPF